MRCVAGRIGEEFAVGVRVARACVWALRVEPACSWCNACARCATIPRMENEQNTQPAAAPAETPMPALDIVLASASPRRKQLLEDAGVRFVVHASEVDETLEPDLLADPPEACKKLAELAAKHTTMEAVDNNILIEKSTNADGGDHHELKLNDVVEIGSGANKVTIDGTNGTVSTGNINMNGTNGMITADKITIDGGAGTIGGLTNTTWDADNYISGQAASEDQLKTVYDTAVKYDVDSGGNINTGKITLEGSSGTTIGNVAAGEVSATSMDAVNGSQLYQVKQDINNINQDITKLGDEIDTVGALSAAMAGLHPRFQDGNKGELAMAYGGYGGKSALAVGGFYAPNEKVMFSLGLGISEGGSKMGNFGVNFALDRSRDRKAEPRDIIYTRKEVDNSLAAQDEKIQLLLAKVEEQSREMEKQSREIEYLRAQVEK